MVDFRWKVKMMIRSKKIKLVLSVIVLVSGIAAAIYFGLWIMFIKSILTACAAFDAGSLTGMVIGTTILKCIFAGTVSSIIIRVTCGIGKWLIE